MLRPIFVDPASLDPSTVATQVTKEVAEHLAKLARSLTETGYAPERVASFLTRCIVTMFAENIGLLREHIFTKGYRTELDSETLSVQRRVGESMARDGRGHELGVGGSMLRFNGSRFL